MLIKNWVYFEKQNGTPDKLKLIDLPNNDIPETIAKLNKLSEYW